VEYIPYKHTERTMKTSDFFATKPIFSLDEAARVLAPPGGRAGTVERLKHHLQTGKLQLVSRGIYAVLPAGLTVEKFRPDPFLVAAAIRANGIFSHHSALELLGTAQSMWNKCTLYTSQRRRALDLNGSTIYFLEHPSQFQASGDSAIGTRRIERRGQLLRTTGPERTLVEGFRRPALAGGLEELVNSAAAFQVLDLHLLESILHRYDISNLWAAVGWFLVRHQKDFHIPKEFIALCEKNQPKSPQYLERNSRGGRLAARWNLILPQSLNAAGGADEP
jgi:predicted transcriptional regulator of viral defense system